MTAATVEIKAQHQDPSATFTYIVGGKEQTTNKISVGSEVKGPLTVSIKASDGSKIDLEDLDFRWNVEPLLQREGDNQNGQKGAIVELFGWPHADIEQECEALGKMGYLGVKIYPAQEQVMSTEPFNNVMNPWYFMYQPVSYRLQGRMGTRDDLRRMISACRKNGVRVYADAVINHMSGGGNDANPKHRNPQANCQTFGNKTSSLPGGHSPYYTQNYAYTTGEHTGKAPLQEFPAVPYGPQDFHCERVLNAWSDPLDLNAGWLTGLTDLNTERENVQERIADYMTDLISIGISGFRIDAAKHIKPDDLVQIILKFRENVGGKMPEDWFSWLEILLGGEADLLMCNTASGYNYGEYLSSALLKAGLSQPEVDAVKTWNSGFPKEPEKGVDNCDIGKTGLQRQVIQNDDADQQNPGSSSRDMGDAGCVLIKGCDESTHRGHEVSLFTSPPGAQDNAKDYPIRVILSSYYWGEGDNQGIPDGKSDCSLCKVNCDGCKGMPFQQAFDAKSTGYDKGKGMYTRVHRDKEIVNAMRAWVGLKAIDTSVYTGVEEPAYTSVIV
ncbi:Amy2 [Symbiodinium pilosum]|uniref:Alpha-amylase n=1 Tax=Symbiodinium pilosum TaxID=2952 RepID=A0A812N0J4_SYMPI|nr:Amy2 [Symbiodinium pilosum]